MKRLQSILLGGLFTALLLLQPGCATYSSGQPGYASQYPNVRDMGNGQLRPMEGYQWINPDAPNDYRVLPVPSGTPHERFPNVVWSTPSELRPAEGYRWVNPGASNDYRVESVPSGTPHERHPNVVWASPGELRPANGYRWVDREAPNDYRVVPVQAGTPHEEHPNVVWSEPGQLRPAPGYRWVDPEAPNDYRVEPVAGSGSEPAPSRGAVVAGGFAGDWETTFGRLQITLTGTQASGTYTHGGGSTLEGTVKGNGLSFRYREPNAVGEGWFQLAADGRSFSGRWRQDGTDTWYNWEGTRVAGGASIPSGGRKIR